LNLALWCCFCLLSYVQYWRSFGLFNWKS
ncbi:unnamed protein product, partial [Cuscuta campestris]